MSNVCSVPLSYIFLRGQGVKIFSLVAKQCRLEGFLIITRAKKRNRFQIIREFRNTNSAESHEASIKNIWDKALENEEYNKESIRIQQ